MHKYQGNQYCKPHTFRHSYAVHCFKKGMNIGSLQKILEHTEPNTTAIYLDFLADDIIEDYQKVEWHQFVQLMQSI